MTEERITTTEDERGNTHTTHVVSDDRTTNGGGAAKWVFLLILVVAIAIGAYLLAQGNASEMTKDAAITDAANEVGEAAGQVGDAAQDAANEVTGNCLSPLNDANPHPARLSCRAVKFTDT